MGLPTPAPLGPPEDWDEEDDQVTTIFEKSKVFGAGHDSERPGSPAPQALAGRAQGPAPGEPLPQPNPTPLEPAAQLSADLESLGLAQPVGPASHVWTVLAMVGAVLAVVVGLGYYWFALRPGSILITVSGPGRTAVDLLEVTVDGQVVCRESPCRVAKLRKGPHTVTAAAPGYVKSAARVLTVEPGRVTVENFDLLRAATGIRVGALAPKLRLFVDGHDRGPLPATADDLRPGEHEIRIEGNDRFRPYVERITLASGEMKTLEPKLKVAKGLAKLEPSEEARGARAVLSCAGERRVELSLPTVVEVPVEKSCQIEASKQGFEDTTIPLVFEEGNAEKSFTIDLPRKAEEPARPPVAAAPVQTRARPARAMARTTTAKQPTAATPEPAPAVEASGGSGTIAINSVPASTVTVDGRAAGQTPTRVDVPAGKHTVVFSHPERGQKSLVITVKPGATVPAVVRF